MQPEEQVYFKCSNHYTESFVRDHTIFVALSNARGLLSVVMWPAYCLIFALIGWFANLRSYIIIAAVIVGTVMYLTRVLSKKPTRKRYEQIMVSNNGKELQKQILFTQLGFYTKNMDSSNEEFMSYEYFTGFVPGNNFAAIISRANTWYIFDLRTLDGGSKEAFFDFLWQHCPLIKRRKKVRKTPWKTLNAVLITILAISILLSVLILPGLYLKERISGKMGNYMSYQQIADKLEDIGITGADKKLIAAVEKDYGDLVSDDYHPYAEVQLMLVYLGEGSYSDRTGWTPSENGVYWLALEAWDLEYMYTYCLEGISALDPDLLQFYGIQETCDRAAINTGIGTCEISFTFNKEKHTITADVEYDWFDPAFLDALNQIISADGKQLYFTSVEGQGLLVFYRDAQWAKDFTKLTGIKLYTNTDDIEY